MSAGLYRLPGTIPGGGKSRFGCGDFCNDIEKSPKAIGSGTDFPWLRRGSYREFEGHVVDSATIHSAGVCAPLPSAPQGLRDWSRHRSRSCITRDTDIDLC